MSNLGGCCFYQANAWHYLPQISLKAHATILSSTSRTTLTQKFTNSSDHLLEEVSYKFPFYDGVSVVGFECRVGTRYLHSKVETKEQANADFNNAVANDQTAAIMEHGAKENDVFVTRLGNVPTKETITVEITFIGELKQDAQSDGIRYTLPNTIAPRYPDPGFLRPSRSKFLPPYVSEQQPVQPPQWGLVKTSGIDITVDVQMEKTSNIRELQSPSHPVKVSLGRTSTKLSGCSSESAFDPSQASASLRLAKENGLLIERDFVLVVKADGLDNPTALLETHSSIPDQRALMVTLVPKFNLPPIKPEVIFVIDRSASMGQKIPTLRSALQIFLKSLPVGICFNLCSFGNDHHFLWPQSRVYDKLSLHEASAYVETINADMGGTNMTSAVKATVASRLNDKQLEVLILTDGQIFDQQNLFDFVRETVTSNKSEGQSARFFSLGIGNETSHSLIEGIARSGNGISQSVLKYEELDRKVVRMLKGALTPHIGDYKLLVDYDSPEQDFEVVDTVDSIAETITESGDEDGNEDLVESFENKTAQSSISLFDESFQESDAELGTLQDKDNESNILPDLSPPDVLQAPYQIPPLYPFIRSYVYLLLDPKSSDRVPRSLMLSATSNGRPLQLRIPIKDSVHGETIHQLASRKAMIELEEEHSWLEHSKDRDGNPFSRLHVDTKSRLAKRECQILGLRYQVTGKYCTFVALEEESTDKENDHKEEKEQEKVSKIGDKSLPVKAPVFNIIQACSNQLGPGGSFATPMYGGFGSSVFSPMSAGAPVRLVFAGQGPHTSWSNQRQQAQMKPASPFASPGAGVGFGQASNPGDGGNPTFGAFMSNPSAQMQNQSQSQSSTGSLFGGSVRSTPLMGAFDSMQSVGAAFSAAQRPQMQQASFMNRRQPASGSLFEVQEAQRQQSMLRDRAKSLFEIQEAQKQQALLRGHALGGQQTQSSSSIFGQQSNPQAMSAFGSPFGASNHQQAQPTSGALFGASPPSVPQHSSLFGGAPNHQNIPSTGGVSSAPPASAPQHAALFGGAPNHQNTPATGSLFGAAPTTSSPYLSGNAPKRQKPSISGGAFGNAPSQYQTSLFDSAQPSNAQISSGFGTQNTTTPNPGSLFGSPNPTKQAPLNSQQTNKSKLHSLIALQNFQGSWSLTQELCNLLGCDEDMVRQHFINLLGFSSLPSAPPSDPTESGLGVLATLMAMGYLEHQHAEEMRVWELVFGKAKAWLEGVLPGLGEAGSKIQARRKEIMSLDFLEY